MKQRETNTGGGSSHFCPHGAPWTQCPWCSVPEPDYAAFGREVAKIMGNTTVNYYVKTQRIIAAATRCGVSLEKKE